MTRALREIRDSVERCHGNIKAPVDDDILEILRRMSEWMAGMERALGAQDAREPDPTEAQ